MDSASTPYSGSQQTRNKFGAKRCSEDGYDFDSLAEREHYRQLKLRLMAGEIESLVVHPSYVLEVNGERICRFTLDFQYTDLLLKKRLTVDVKGGKATRTRDYKLRKKLLYALYAIEVVEVG